MHIAGPTVFNDSCSQVETTTREQQQFSDISPPGQDSPGHESLRGHESQQPYCGAEVKTHFSNLPGHYSHALLIISLLHRQE